MDTEWTHSHITVTPFPTHRNPTVPATLHLLAPACPVVHMTGPRAHEQVRPVPPCPTLGDHDEHTERLCYPSVNHPSACLAHLGFSSWDSVVPPSRSAYFDLAAATWACFELHRRANIAATIRCAGASFRKFSFVQFSSAGDALNTPRVVRAVALMSSGAVLKLCHTRIACVNCGVPAAVDAHPAPVAPNSRTVCRSTILARYLGARTVGPQRTQPLLLCRWGFSASLPAPPKGSATLSGHQARASKEQVNGPRQFMIA